MSFVEIDQVSLHFAGLLALDGVSLRIEQGEMVGLIGPNGSGKTTLLNVLTGHYAPDAGSVRLEGRPTGGLRPNQIARLGITRMFQLTRLFHRLSTLDNLITAGCAVGLGYDAAHARADALIEELGLGEVRDEDGSNLSGGQQKLLEFGRVIMRQASLILLDEVTAGVHPNIRKIILEAITRLRERGVSFLIIEHDMEMVRSVCDRIIVMDSGRVVASGAFEDIVRDSEVMHSYLGRPQ